MDKPTGSSHLNFSLAALFAGGGIGGYVKAKSMPSLIMNAPGFRQLSIIYLASPSLSTYVHSSTTIKSN